MDAPAAADVGAAKARLPERQREALELLGQDLSYGEIAARLETSRGSVAKLIAHARINLYDELRGTVLASVAPSAECERALPLIAERQDGELDLASADATWLDGHLEDCGRCRRGVEEMGESSTADGEQGQVAVRPLRRTTLAVGLAALLLLTGVAAAMRAGDGATTRSAGSATGSGLGSEAVAPAADGQADKGDTKRKVANTRDVARTKSDDAGTGEVTEAPAPTSVPVPETGSDGPSEANPRPAGLPGQAAVQAPRPTSVSKPTQKPAPAPTPTPSTAPAPVVEEPAVVDEPVEEASRRREPPGKPEGKPPH